MFKNRGIIGQLPTFYVLAERADGLTRVRHTSHFVRCVACDVRGFERCALRPARANIKKMENSTIDPSNPGPTFFTFMNSLSHTCRPPPALPTTWPSHAARSQTDIKISTTCSQLSRGRHERVRPRPPQRGARGPAGSGRTGAQQHQVAPRRRLRVQLVLDVLATGAWHLVGVGVTVMARANVSL